MKKTMKLFGIALAVVIILAMTGCQQPGDSGDPGYTSKTYTGYDADGNTYTLVITTTADNPQNGDSYVLTITDANGSPLGTSTGTVSDVDDTTLTLQKGSDTFTVTVDGSAIKTITEDIPLDVGGPREPPAVLFPTNPNTPDPDPDTDPDLDRIDFGTDTGIIYRTVSSGAELYAYWRSITVPGNYVIKVAGDLNDEAYLDLNDASPGNSIFISLRGAGNSIASATVLLDTGETLILRDITLNGGSAVSCRSHSKLIMEADSVITGDSSLRIEDDGVFIMNGGEIYGNSNSDGGGVTIKGANAHFEKNSVGKIYNNTSTAEFGQQVLVLDNNGGPLVYRDEAVTADETLAITLNASGDGIESQTGTWKESPLNAINEADFGTTEGIIYKNDVSDEADLNSYWDSITEPGNYVINVTGNIVGVINFDFNDSYSGTGIIISLRGAGYSITTSSNVNLDSGETLILRNITIIRSSTNGANCNSNSKLIMEAGSTITGGDTINVSEGGELIMKDGSAITGSKGVNVYNRGTFTMNGGKIHDSAMDWTGVTVGEDSVFIMNGGEIYNNSGYTGEAGGVTIKGANVRFEKNPGGRIYNNTSKADHGKQVLVLDVEDNILAYRDDEVAANETLTITLITGADEILHQTDTGTWSTIP